MTLGDRGLDAVRTETTADPPGLGPRAARPLEADSNSNVRFPDKAHCFQREPDGARWIRGRARGG